MARPVPARLDHGARDPSFRIAPGPPILPRSDEGASKMTFANRSRARIVVGPVVGVAALLSLAMASGGLASAQSTAPDVEITGVVREIHGETYADGHVREIDERFTVDTAGG